MVTQGHRNDTDQSATYDFLLTSRSNDGPISYRFRDKLPLQSKTIKCSHPSVFKAPAFPNLGRSLLFMRTLQNYYLQNGNMQI